jgi:WD40 repeat protein
LENNPRFISSTFRDIQAERDHLVRFVFPKLREELLKWRIQRLFGGSNDKTVREWDAASGQEPCCLRGHEGCVVCVAYSPNRRRILSGADEGSVRRAGGQKESRQRHQG